MACGSEEEVRRGPSNWTIAIGLMISIAGLVGSGVAAWNTVQTDLASLKRGEYYKEQTDQRQDQEMRQQELRQRETMREFSDKLDRIIEHLAVRGR